MATAQQNTARPARAGGLQVVARTADVLRALMAHPGGMTLGELSAEVALPKSSVHRLVAALDQEDLVRTGERGRIRIGPLLMQLAHAGERALGDELQEAVRALSDDLEETVDLSVLDGDAIRFVAQRPGQKRLRAVSSVGARFPLHCTSAGKAFLAHMPREQASALLPARLPRLTAQTITSRKALWEELDAVRETAIAYDREEHHDGIAAVGTLVQDAFGSIAAITVPVPSQRFYGREQVLARHLRAVCAPVLAVSR